jgi:bifunctional non-homologous end joining protein LigD
MPSLILPHLPEAEERRRARARLLRWRGTTETARSLWKQLHSLRSPFAARLPSLARKGGVWVKPDLVAEVDYRGRTADEQLRHASFKGLREDKDPRSVVRGS